MILLQDHFSTRISVYVTSIYFVNNSTSNKTSLIEIVGLLVFSKSDFVSVKCSDILRLDSTFFLVSSMISLAPFLSFFISSLNLSLYLLIYIFRTWWYIRPGLLLLSCPNISSGNKMQIYFKRIKNVLINKHIHIYMWSGVCASFQSLGSKGAFVGTYGKTKVEGIQGSETLVCDTIVQLGHMGPNVFKII